MKYYYENKTSPPDLDQLESYIAGSEMEDKSIIWSRWDENITQITLNFENELSGSDKTILDGIVEA